MLNEEQKNCENNIAMMQLYYKTCEGVVANSIVDMEQMPSSG